MITGLKTIKAIRELLAAGNEAVIRHDSNVTDGWHIDIGGRSFCGYRTRQDARDALANAKDQP